VILVQENAATLVVDQACADIHAGDYLRPIEKVNVPLVLSRPYPDRLTPPSGKLGQYVVDIQGDSTIAGAGQFVTIDAGSQAVSRREHLRGLPHGLPVGAVPRNVLGELAVVAVRDGTATAKVNLQPGRDHDRGPGRAS
jgi:hypothetical protein